MDGHAKMQINIKTRHLSFSDSARIFDYSFSSHSLREIRQRKSSEVLYSARMLKRVRLPVNILEFTFLNIGFYREKW